MYQFEDTCQLLGLSLFGFGAGAREVVNFESTN